MKTLWQKRIFILLSLIFTVLIIESHIGDTFTSSQTLSLEYQLQERSRNIKDVCEQNKLELMWPQNVFRKNIKNHVWDFTHGLAYCPIAKVASTTWFLNFQAIMNINIKGFESMQESRTIVLEDDSFVKKGKRGKISKINFRGIVRNITAPDNWNFKELTKVLEVMTPFMIVRHPFSRLVSAYEDKMLNPNFLSKRKLTTVEEFNSQPSFHEFVSWLLDTRSNKSGTQESWKNDKAFSPFFSACPVCQVDYSVIKLDGEGNEIDSWIGYLGLNLTSTEAHTEGGAQSSTNRALDYFSQLTKEQVEELYNVYKLDFILFSYKPDIFINAAKGHLTDDKMASLRTFSQPPKPQSINQNFGSIFQIFNFGKPKKITKTSTQKDNIKDKKSLDFLNRAKLKQKLKIDNFNKRVSPSMTS
eukprot:TRINITY_DN13371_c0_g1_i3.p1 TRINITY_DN13371_c0_g1~~TRINITY_DN13371_c0_g1_i3.p1  ORF type:complete len:415 (+),score=60.42 TRINITY_DN13371_c0_g1_i3:269-1513(+)